MLARRTIAAFASRSPLVARATTNYMPFGARSVHIEATKESIQAAIKSEKVLVFSKTYCPYCARVKALFEDLEVDHEVIELDECADGTKIQDLLLELSKQRTVPNVFIKGKHIGGCDATIALHADKKLLPMVQ